MKTSRTSPHSGDHVIERSHARTAAFWMRLSYGTVQLIIKLFRAFQHNSYYQTTVLHEFDTKLDPSKFNMPDGFKTWQMHRNVRIPHKDSI
jgi:hypothetical protein